MITISDEIVNQSGLDERRFKIKLAIMMYETHLTSLDQAAAFAQISKYEMQHQLAVKGIKIRWEEDYKPKNGQRKGGGMTIHYMAEDFDAPLEDFKDYA